MQPARIFPTPSARNSSRERRIARKRIFAYYQLLEHGYIAPVEAGLETLLCEAASAGARIRAAESPHAPRRDTIVISNPIGGALPAEPAKQTGPDVV